MLTQKLNLRDILQAWSRRDRTRIYICHFPRFHRRRHFIASY